MKQNPSIPHAEGLEKLTDIEFLANEHSLVISGLLSLEYTMKRFIDKIEGDCTVADFLDHTADLVVGVKCINQTVLADESFCQFDHFSIALLFSSLDCFSRNHGFSIAEHHVQNDEYDEEWYVI